LANERQGHAGQRLQRCGNTGSRARGQEGWRCEKPQRIRHCGRFESDRTTAVRAITGKKKAEVGGHALQPLVPPEFTIRTGFLNGIRTISAWNGPEKPDYPGPEGGLDACSSLECVASPTTRAMHRMYIRVELGGSGVERRTCWHMTRPGKPKNVQPLLAQIARRA